MNHAKIKIGGDTRIIRFGLKPLGDCVAQTEGGIPEFLKSIETNPFHAVPLLFYYGLKWGAEAEGEIPDFTLEKVYVWLEDLPKGIQDDLVTQVVQLFIRSIYDNVPAVREYVDGLEDETKKNLIGTLT